MGGTPQADDVMSFGGPGFQACLSQLRSEDDDERLVGLFMLTKVLPPNSLCCPENGPLRLQVFDAIGAEFMKRLLATKDDDFMSRNLALNILSSFVVETEIAMKFRSATPVILRAMRSDADAAVVRDAILVFAGVFQSNADISAAGYGKCVVSLCHAATVLQTAGADQECFIALNLAGSVIDRWSSSTAPISADTDGYEVLICLAKLSLDKSIEVSLSAARLAVKVVETPVARTALVLPHAGKAAPVLRNTAKQLLSVYGSQPHVDVGLQLATVIVSQLPEAWSSEPQFALLVMRQCGVEMKLTLDELEGEVAGVLSPDEKLGELDTTHVKYRRAMESFGTASALVDAAIGYLTAHTAQDAADLDAVTPQPAAASASGDSEGAAAAGPVSPEKLMELLHRDAPTGPAGTTDSFAQDKAKAEEAKKAAAAAMREKLSITSSRWLEFPGDVLLMLRASLEDIVRVLFSFVSIVGHCDALAGVLRGSCSGAVPPVSVVWLALFLHPFLSSSARLLGKFLSEDCDSFGEEVIDVLPFVLRIQPRASDSGSQPSRPRCLQLPMCHLLPALVTRTVDAVFLRKFAASGCEGPALVAEWSSAACRALLICVMERKRQRQSGVGVDASPADAAGELLPLLSFASNVLVNCFVVGEQSSVEIVLAPLAWLPFVKAVSAVITSALAAPSMTCFQVDERELLNSVCMHLLYAGLYVLKGVGGEAALAAISADVGSVLDGLKRAVTVMIAAGLLAGDADSGVDLDDINQRLVPRAGIHAVLPAIRAGFPRLFA